MATYRSRTWECPECDRQFDYLHTVTNGDEEPPPAFCPKCGASMTDDPVALPSNFRVGSTRAKSSDRTYRQMEDASDARAEMMAQQTGLDKSEFSHTKITNLRDNLRPGDQAAVLPPNPVSQMMSQAPQAFGFKGSGAEYAGATQVGPGAGRHGHSTRRMLQANHAQEAARVAAQGRIKK